MSEMEDPKTVFEEAVMSRLEVIERQNQQILALLAKMADSSSVDLPAPSGRRGGKYTPEQWQAIVKDPRILREMSRQDTSKRRKKALATRPTTPPAGKENRIVSGRAEGRAHE